MNFKQPLKKEVWWVPCLPQAIQFVSRSWTTFRISSKQLSWIIPNPFYSDENHRGGKDTGYHLCVANLRILGSPSWLHPWREQIPFTALQKGLPSYILHEFWLPRPFWVLFQETNIGINNLALVCSFCLPFNGFPQPATFSNLPTPVSREFLQGKIVHFHVSMFSYIWNSLAQLLWPWNAAPPPLPRNQQELESKEHEVSISLQIRIYMATAMLYPKAKGRPIIQREW